MARLSAARDMPETLHTKGRSRPISACPLLARQEKEATNRLTLIPKQVDANLAGGADAAPATDEGGSAEEVRFERHSVKARHVPSRVDSLNIQAEPMLGHGWNLRLTKGWGPTTFVNRSSLIDSRI